MSGTLPNVPEPNLKVKVVNNRLPVNRPIILSRLGVKETDILPSLVTFKRF